jgi:hypothetical protein
MEKRKALEISTINTSSGSLYCGCIPLALVKALSRSNIRNGFNATRIFPFNNQGMEKFLGPLETYQVPLTLQGLILSLHRNRASMSMRWYAMALKDVSKGKQAIHLRLIRLQLRSTWPRNPICSFSIFLSMLTLTWTWMTRP